MKQNLQNVSMKEMCHRNDSKWVTDCCLTPRELCYEKNKLFLWDDDDDGSDVRFALDKHA